VTEDGGVQTLTVQSRSPPVLFSLPLDQTSRYIIEVTHQPRESQGQVADRLAF